MLRKNQTEAERALWQRLRNRQLMGYKFRRQLPVLNYIVDFVSCELKLIIELDGSQHMEQQEYDLRRTHALENEGYTVVRFWNNEVLQNIESVLEALTLTLTRREKGLKIE